MPEPGPPAPRGRRWIVVLAGVVVVAAAATGFAVLAASPEPPVRVVYEVDGEAERATVTYSTFQGGGTRQVELTAFPWRLELLVADRSGPGVLTVTTGPAGGDVACQVSVDGVELRSATATGAGTSALCDGF